MPITHVPLTHTPLPPLDGSRPPWAGSVEKAGDIIPQILRSVAHAEGSAPLERPTHCPACRSAVVVEEIFVRCPNPACPAQRAITSGRRWERRGVLRTILLMWRLRLMYFLGAHPDRLARLYRG